MGHDFEGPPLPGGLTLPGNSPCGPGQAGFPKLNQKFRFRISPHFQQLLNNPQLPVGERRALLTQVWPDSRELETSPGTPEYRDPLGEEERMILPGLIHRYPDRVLWLVTSRCASYCRYCTRKRVVSQPTRLATSGHWERMLARVAERTDWREVILSGGDPAILPFRRLGPLLVRLGQVSHLERIRVHSRILTFAPGKITDEWHAKEPGWDQLHGRLHFVTHFNHPAELGDKSRAAAARLRELGFQLWNQSVLLAGVNDNPETLDELHTRLLRSRIAPYYLHQLDPVDGTAHFRLPLRRALEILAALQGHRAGLTVPRFIVDLPGGHGKVQLSPNMLPAKDQTHLPVTSWSGYQTRLPLD